MLGGVGSGSSFKIVVNLMLGHSTMAFVEAITLGESLGLSKGLLLEILPKLPVAAPFLSKKAIKIKNMNFDVEFPLELMYKDLHLATLTAYENEIALPSTNIVKELFALANQMGMVREDFSAIYKLLKHSK